MGDSFHLSREHIINQLNCGFAHIMDAYSLTTDYIRFSKYVTDKKKDSNGRDTKEYLNEDMKLIKEKYLKYIRMVFADIEGIRIEYEHPYKSDKLKHVTEAFVYIDEHHQHSQQYSSKLTAETQSYLFFLSRFNFDSQGSADRLNKILSIEISCYNEIMNDDAKFIKNGTLIGAQGKFPLKMGEYLMEGLTDVRILRHSKISRLVE